MGPESLPDDELLPLLKVFVAKATETILITDADIDAPGGPLIRYVNEMTQRTSGYDAAELVGHRLGVFYPPAALEPILKQMRDVRRSGEPASIETVANSKDGKSIFLEVNIIPIVTSTGRVSDFIRIGRDVTARKRAEADRETTQRLLASVFGAIEQAFGILDEGNRFVMINTAMTRQLGWGVFDLLGKPFTTVIAVADRIVIERQLDQAEAMTFRHAATLLRRDGTILAGELAITTIPQPDGRQYRSVMLVPRAAPLGDGDFRDAVRRSLQAGGGSVVAGKIQMVGLTEVRAALGDRWPKVAERTFEIAERIIRRYLGPTDVMSRTTDDGFLVCFAELDEAAAQFKAGAIGREVREKLIGEFPEMAVTVVTGFAAAVPVTAEDETADTDIAQALETRLARARTLAEVEAMRTMRARLATAQIRFTPLRTEANRAAPIVLADLPGDLERAQATLVNLGHAEFIPQAELLLLTGAAERVLGDVAQATDLIVTKVRIATLVNRREAEAWLNVARGLGATGKKRLVLEIAEISRDVARSRLSEAVALVAPMFRTVALELPSADLSFIALLPSATQLVTIDNSQLGHASAASLERLVKALEALRCRLIVKNVPPSLAPALAKAGIRLMGVGE